MTYKALEDRDERRAAENSSCARLPRGKLTEEQASQPGEDYLAFLRRMDDLKYKRPDPLPPASMSKNAGKLPLFWIAYSVIVIVGTWLFMHVLD
ncbi:hypothetical protein [Streptomyces sp. NPDC002758]